MTRKKFKESRSRPTLVREELNVDLAGPFNPNSLGGSKYNFIIVETVSNFCWVKPIKLKGEAAHEFKDLLTLWERKKLLRNLKTVVWDNGKGEHVKYFRMFYSTTDI